MTMRMPHALIGAFAFPVWLIAAAPASAQIAPTEPADTPAQAAPAPPNPPAIEGAPGPVELPGIVVDASKPPPPISRPSARDPGPAAQARVRQRTRRRQSPPRRSAAQRRAAAAQSPAQPTAVASAETAPSGPEPVAPTVITPNRAADDIGAVATSVSVVGSAEIERARSGGAAVVDVLRGLPGFTIRRNGGVGAGADVHIRGADSDQTLVMLDGVPLNDPASAGGEFDFSVLSLANVDRIEVLRGPQSGVYGGDAIGGVVNIVTKRSTEKPSAYAEIEGGSFGTHAQRLGASGSVGRFDFGVGVSNFYSSGFSRRADDEEDDATRKQAVAGTFGYQISNDARLSARLGYYRLNAQIDRSSTRHSDIGNTFDRDLFDGAITATVRSLGGLVTTKAVAFANRTERNVKECRGLDCAASNLTDYEGSRYGVELLSTVKLREEADRLVIGGRWLTQSGRKANARTDRAGQTVAFDESERQRAVFASYQFNPVEAFTVTLSGRLDDFGSGDFDGTYRVAAAYRFAESGTKLRASYGTGIKAPTIFQRFDTTFGNGRLDVETSRGFDVGVDQSLFDGTVEVSATYFENDIKDQIVFTGDFFTGTYENIERVQTRGVELAAEWRAASWLRLRGSYTNLDATDGTTGRRLRRRPEHVAKGTVAIEPFAGAQIAATVLRQSHHFNDAFDPADPGADRERVQGYTRLDLTADYNIADGATLFLRAENLTDADYQDVKDFNTPGRSAYGGIRVRF